MAHQSTTQYLTHPYLIPSRTSCTTLSSSPTTSSPTTTSSSTTISSHAISSFTISSSLTTSSHTPHPTPHPLNTSFKPVRTNLCVIIFMVILHFRPFIDSNIYHMHLDEGWVRACIPSMTWRHSIKQVRGETYNNHKAVTQKEMELRKTRDSVRHEALRRRNRQTTVTGEGVGAFQLALND